MGLHIKTNNIIEINLTKKILKKNSRIFKNFAKNTQEKLKDFAKKNTQKSPRIFKDFAKILRNHQGFSYKSKVLKSTKKVLKSTKKVV